MIHAEAVTTRSEGHEPADPAALVARYAAAKSRQDVEAALACCADDFVLDTIPSSGKSQTAPQLGLFFATFPDYGVTLAGQSVAPGVVTAWGTVRATMRGSFGSFAPTGRACALPFVCVFGVAGGRLTAERFFLEDLWQ